MRIVTSQLSYHSFYSQTSEMQSKESRKQQSGMNQKASRVGKVIWLLQKQKPLPAVHVCACSKEREHCLQLAFSGSHGQWRVARAVAGVHSSRVAVHRSGSSRAALLSAAAALLAPRRLLLGYGPHGRSAHGAARFVVAAVSGFVEWRGAFYESTEVSPAVEERSESLNLGRGNQEVKKMCENAEKKPTRNKVESILESNHL